MKRWILRSVVMAALAAGIVASSPVARAADDKCVIDFASKDVEKNKEALLKYLCGGELLESEFPGGMVFAAVAEPAT